MGSSASKYYEDLGEYEWLCELLDEEKSEATMYHHMACMKDRLEAWMREERGE
jgi:hypothetical protein